MSIKQSSGKDFAAEAVARLYSGHMTEAEERAIEAWLQSDPGHRKEFQKMLDAWDVAGDLGKSIKDLDVGEVQSRRAGNKTLFGIAASVAVLAGLLLLILFSGTPGTQLERFATKVGELREITLVDGSHLTLNTDTELMVDFSETQRRITLDHGEAFFDIEKDPSRPLIVAAGDQNITVLGTSFNVNWDGKEVTVAVMKGRVAVQSKGAAESAAEHLRRINDEGPDATGPNGLTNGVLLLAGEVAQISHTTQPITATVMQDSERYESWRFGYIRFEYEPLSTVIEEINRYTTIPLTIEDAVIADMEVSGVFRTTDVKSTISGLELLFPIKVLDRGNHYLIVSASN